MTVRTRYADSLKEQYGFLRRSIDSAMDGHDEEALRIATAIRVLVHETASSKPLLKNLNPNYLQLTILDIPAPARAKERPTTLIFYMGIGFEMNASTGLRPIIDLANGPPGQQLVLLGLWWDQIILVFNDVGRTVTFTRKQLLITLANKEGGAHVDMQLPRDYEKFVLASPVTLTVNSTVTDTAHLARYAAVQAGAQMCECLKRNFPTIIV